MIIWMKVTPLKVKSGSMPSFYSMLLKTHDGVTNLSNSVQWLVDSLFSQVKERISAHLSDTADVDKETILKMCEPGDIFLGLNTRHLRENFYKERFNFVSRCSSIYTVL